MQRWQIQKTRERKISSNEFHSIVDYYIACLEKEDMLSLTFDLKKDKEKIFRTIFETDVFFQTQHAQVILQKSDEINTILKKCTNTQKNKHLFYGYPLAADAHGMISPLFFTEITFEEKEDTIMCTPTSLQPQFNHYILSKSGYEMEEITHLRKEIEENDDFQVNLKKIRELLSSDKNNLPRSKKKNTEETQPHIVDRVIVYFGEKTGIVSGLLRELHKLKNVSFGDIESSSLGYILGKKTKTSEIKNKDIVEIFALNDAQKQSVNSALTQPLTVITGPPGTGKSQVVINIIANAIYNDKSVLFASKNNKAVDVVTEKLRSILPHPLIIRMGAKPYRRNARSEMLKLFLEKDFLNTQTTRKATVQDLVRITEQIDLITNKLTAMAELNTIIDKAQEEIDSFCEQLPSDLFSRWNKEVIVDLNEKKLEHDLKKLFKNETRLIRKFFRKIFPNHHKKKQQQCFYWYYEKFSPCFKEYIDTNIDITRDGLKKVLHWIFICTKIVGLQKVIHTAKNNLSVFPSVYELYQKMAMLKKEKIDISRVLFIQYWLNKLRNASINDHEQVSRFFAVSEQLEGWIESSTTRNQLLTEQEDSLQTIVSFLPAWVVTNLSAKNSFPFKDQLFDLLIIDEASQCDIPSAFPLFYRAKQVVIIGDPKQLKHISMLREIEDRSIAAEKKIEGFFLDFSYSKNSLYDLGEKTIGISDEKPFFLNEHYRSHDDVIAFSNNYFYDKRLIILTDEQRLLKENGVPFGIHWNDIQGQTIASKSPYNLEEVDCVLALLSELKQLNLSDASFGVVTLFRAQMEIILEKINQRDSLRDMNITVGTAHRFQGDEKDVILFSPAISKGIKQGTLHWVHSTQQLLNVAITRARSTVFVVGDKQACLEANGVLKALAEYTEEKESKEFVLSSFKQRLYGELVNSRIPIKVHYRWSSDTKTSPIYLDFALFTNGKKYDIEVEEAFSSEKEQQLMMRDKQLRCGGWQVRRFYVGDNKSDPINIIEEIIRLC
ncbi:MAG: DEAD/DEAH box helicase [Euryarchaeota archaeon]|nr:DEAD/DEAH box helicase [Euryarchaeota archaeon]